MDDRNTKISAIGKSGETIISNWFTLQGSKVIMSEDSFDHTKDMIIDGKTVEIKTQVPFVKEKAFSFRENQLRKCSKVDLVIFIAIPNSVAPSSFDGKVYMIEGSKMKTRNYVTRDNRSMVLVDIDQPDMQYLFTLNHKQCNILQKNSVSAWK